VILPSRWESVVEVQIRMAQERGEFDDLPGKGKPIPGLDDPDDDLWWVRGFIRREGLPIDALLPTSLRLRKEIEQLANTVRKLPTEQAVRDAVTELNTQIAAWIRTPSGPQLWIQPVGLDDVLRDWRAGRQEPDERPSPAESAARESGGVPGKRSWWRHLTARRGER
jgi:hypothetical protein